MQKNVLNDQSSFQRGCSPENHLQKGHKEKHQAAYLMLSRPFLTAYSIAADVDDVKTTSGRHWTTLFII